MAQAADPAGVVFDMDGVLVDSGQHHRAAWSAALAELGETPAAGEFWRLTIGRPAHEAVSLLLGRAISPAEAWRVARLKQAHYGKLARQGPLPVPGVENFLSVLDQHGVPRAVATSASRFEAERLLGRLGLAPHFEVVITAEDVRRGKPDPEAYLKAARQIGVAPRDCLVFEDALVGAASARAAGMRVIGLTTAHTAAELMAAGAERAITDFEGLSWPP
ncbi:MAG: HAD family hydrolase [Candidatus Rokuibacteriota bacterium]